jgi:hypothetical protein
MKLFLFIFFLIFFNVEFLFSQQDSSSHFITNKDSLPALFLDSSRQDSSFKQTSNKGSILPFFSQDSTYQKSFFPHTDSSSKPAINKGSLPFSLPDSAHRTSFISNVKNKINIDSTTKKKLLQKIIPKTYGTISAGYDYGVIPFAANIKYPMGYFSSQGNIGFSALGLPLVATYYYSDLKNISGLNNYFRVSFDASRYKNLTRNRTLEKVEEEKEKLSSLNQFKQELIQKLAFLSNLKNGLLSPSTLSSRLDDYKNKYTLDKYKNYDGKIPSKDSLIDSLHITKPSYNDSLSQLKSKLPKVSYGDSISKLNNMINKYDSLSGKIDAYKEQLQKIDQQIKSINNKLQYSNDPQKIVEENHYMKKVQSILAGVKKFDVGLCYPNYSTFLVSGSTVKGINIEWEKKFYFAATYGKTINTIMTTNNVIQNQLQTVRNAYNFFDFNNVKDSRKIAALKFGIGRKDGSHFYAGFLYGLGLPSYVSTIPQTSIEKNLVIELDGKIAFNPSNIFELVYGKSTLYQEGITINSTPSDSRFPFSGYRSNAGQVKYISQIKKTKTKLTATGRIIDPFFNSYGVGFIRSDNIRYELKVDQEITNKIKLSGFYRKDRDNLLNTFSYTTQLQTMGATLSMKLSKSLMVKASYMPVIQNIDSKDSGQKVIHHVNNISNVVITYIPKIGHVTSLFTGTYSYYDLSGNGAKSNNFQNYMISNSTTLNSHFRNDLAVNYFQNNDNDSLNSNTFLFTDNLSYTASGGVMLTAGVKLSQNNISKTQTGGLLKINFPLVKHIHIEVMAEKLVLGDFYSSYNLSEIRKFPFYGYGKLILSW